MTTTDEMPRRVQLLAAIRQQSGEWTAARAARTTGALGFSGHRNTGRKDLRALARRGELVRHARADGHHFYTLRSKAEPS